MEGARAAEGNAGIQESENASERLATSGWWLVGRDPFHGRDVCRLQCCRQLSLDFFDRRSLYDRPVHPVDRCGSVIGRRGPQSVGEIVSAFVEDLDENVRACPKPELAVGAVPIVSGEGKAMTGGKVVQNWVEPAQRFLNTPPFLFRAEETVRHDASIPIRPLTA